MNHIFAALALVALSLAAVVIAIGVCGIVEMLAQEVRNWRKRKEKK